MLSLKKRPKEGSNMSSPLKSRFDSEVDMANIDPEVKSYIYQTIIEFEPYSTPSTLISVVAKDPLKLISRFEADGIQYDHSKLKTMHRISITLAEDGGKLEEEAVHEDIYSAIRLAKEKLLKTLIEIQDRVVTNQERKMQIDTAVGGGHIH